MCVCVCVSTAPGVCVCVCPLFQVGVHLDGSNTENKFPAGYTLYNRVCEKYNFYFLFFLNRYPIMVKCLNKRKNIGKPIYRSISKLVAVHSGIAFSVKATCGQCGQILLSSQGE